MVLNQSKLSWSTFLDATLQQKSLPLNFHKIPKCWILPQTARLSKERGYLWETLLPCLIAQGPFPQGGLSFAERKAHPSSPQSLFVPSLKYASPSLAPGSEAKWLMQHWDLKQQKWQPLISWRMRSRPLWIWNVVQSLLREGSYSATSAQHKEPEINYCEGLEKQKLIIFKKPFYTVAWCKVSAWLQRK